MADYLFQEDGASHLLLEDSSGAILLEQNAIPFIASVTTVYAIAVNAPEVDLPFIASTTVVNGVTTIRHNPHFVASTQNTPVGGGNANDLYVPGGVAEGDLMVAVVESASANMGPVTATGWTQRGEIDGSGDGPSIAVLTKIASASEPASYTLGGAVVGSNACLAYRDVQTEAPDVVGLGTGLTAASLTPHEPDDLEIYVGAANNDAALSGPTGWSARVFFTDAFTGTALLVSDTINDGLAATGTVAPNGSGGANAANARYAHLLFIRVAYRTDVPFIPSVTTVYAPDLPEINVPFITSKTRVFGVFSVFTDFVGTGPGNGGEIFGILLAPNGVSETATVAAGISATDTLLQLAGDGGMPSTDPFILTIDAEVLYVVAIAPGSYRVRGRGMSNTTPAAHIAGATATWSDSYDMAIAATADIAASFTADITGSGSTTYPGWLICFDSSQAYLGGSRYPMHVTELVGVFPGGTGLSGTNRLDASQPNATCTPLGVSDDCPAALSNPARIASSISGGDVAVVRYTNVEAAALLLGSRSTALQSWYGMKRVDDSDTDVTFTDPTGHVVDTIPPAAFTGSVNGEWTPPVLGPGISPSTGLPTSHDVPYTSVTLPGADRYFTDGIHFGEKGWPICALAVRQGKRRVPEWASWDWKDFNYVYSGFEIDATFCQMLINRNGIIFGSVPEVELPGSQDIDGPDAVWDDGSYYFGASWYVAIWAGPYLVIGPGIGGGLATVTSTPSTPVPVVDFATGTPVVTTPTSSGPPPVEGGSGGGIPAPTNARERFDVALV